MTKIENTTRAELRITSNIMRNNQVFLLLIFFLALVLRVTAVFYLSNFDQIDGYELEDAARNFLAGEGLRYKSTLSDNERSGFFYPLYTFVLAGFFKAFSSPYLWIELVQALVGASTVAALYFLTRRIADTRTALIAALILAAYPIHVYWSCRIQPMVIEAFLIVLVTWLVIRSAQEGSIVSLVLAGFFTGMAVLSKSLYQTFIPVWLLWYLYHDKRKVSRRLTFAALFLVLSVSVVSPWIIRNWLIQGQYVGIVLGGGRSLWYGNNPDATGTAVTEEGENFISTLNPETIDKLRRMDEVERDEWFKRKAISYIRKHPLRFLSMSIPKLKSLWWFNELVPSSFGAARKTAYLFIIVPAFFGILISLPRWRTFFMFYLIFGGMSFVYAIYYGEARFRYVIEPLLIIFSALAISRAWAIISCRLAKRGSEG